MKADVRLVRAFTNDPAQGNPAGVVLNADNLSDDQMLSVAQALDYSESAFVQSSDKADFRIRFFASKGEVELCGHATLATFHSLLEKGALTLNATGVTQFTQETKAGVFVVECYPDGKIMMTQNDPFFGNTEPGRQKIATLLGLEENDIAQWPVQTVSTAVAKLMVPVVSPDRLVAAKPDLKAIIQYSEVNHVKGMYLFARDTSENGVDFCARFFNPLVGISQDAATGVAAGPLGCYADKYIYKDGRKQFVIRQGFDIGKDSTLYVDIAGKVKVGGYAATFGQTEIEI